MDAVLLITNAEAGSADDAAVDAAVTALRSRLEVEVVATGTPDELGDVLGGRRSRDVVVAGGDGSLHAVIATLHRQRQLDAPAIGLIPLGTGNDFARGLEIPPEPVDSAEVILEGRRTSVDILVDDEDQVVVNAVHVGVGAEAGQEARPWKRFLGKYGYVVGAVIAGLKTQGQRVRLVADGVELADGSRRVLQIAVGNGPLIGAGTEIAPGADPTDGHVDVLVSFAVNRRDRLLYGVRLKRGTHEERHDVRRVRATTVSLHGQGFVCNIDGELTGPIDDREWTVLPGAFTMFVPRHDGSYDA